MAKVGLRIIYGEAYSGFDSSLLAAKMVRPTEQLASMTERFAARSASYTKFSHWFQPAAKKTTNTRSIKNVQKYDKVPARTARYGKSPIPYLTQILNHKNK